MNQNQEKRLVLPQVRYHPSIQITSRTTTCTGNTTRTRNTTRTSQNCRPEKRPDGDQKETSSALSLALIQDLGSKAAKAPPSPSSILLDRSVTEEVEVLTRGQSTNPAWFSWRKNRITASIAHQIAHSRFANGKSKTPPLSYLSAITGGGQRVQTRAMEWGTRMEAKAVESYQKLKSASLRHSVSVLDCGLFIDAERPWLAASPDGIVTDSISGQWLRSLEVKCPFKHRNRRVEDACRDDPAFCLQITTPHAQPPVYRLKPSHPYFTQVQVQMAVTKLPKADFVVYTLRETAIVSVTFDPVLWEETVSKLEIFYQDAILPHIDSKGQQVRAAEL